MKFTLTQMRAMNQAIGHHWFDRDSMRMWETKIEVYPTETNRYFIHRSTFCGITKRAIAYFAPDGKVHTYYEDDVMPEFETLAEAKAFRKALASPDRKAI